MATPGRLPVPLLAVRATSLGCRALHCTALFRSGQIWWLGWYGRWIPQTSTKAHSLCFWTEGNGGGCLSFSPGLWGGDACILPDRSQERELDL